MKIEVLYFRGCPHLAAARDRLHAMLRRERLHADITEIEVQDEAAAKRLRFTGSPAIRVDGRDVDPEFRNVTETSFACRRYNDGAPSEEMIRAALRAAHES